MKQAGPKQQLAVPILAAVSADFAENRPGGWYFHALLLHNRTVAQLLQHPSAREEAFQNIARVHKFVKMSQ